MELAVYIQDYNTNPTLWYDQRQYNTSKDSYDLSGFLYIPDSLTTESRVPLVHPRLVASWVIYQHS